MYHNPVLLRETIENLAVRPDGLYVDLTFGGGGHSRAILALLSDGQLIAFDQDEDASANAIDDPRFLLIDQNFKYFSNFLQYHNVWPVDGIIADLGISSHQLDQAPRGFSNRLNGPLDMRMQQSQSLTAATILETYSWEDLSRLFRDKGEINNAPRLAKRIIEEREVNPIQTTLQLREIALPLANRNKENQYLAKVFQALRMEVNQELSALQDMLTQLPHALKPGGRVAIITYHSLEDRLVKHFLRSGNLEGRIEKDFYGNEINPFQSITRKAISPGEQEIHENPRARSAKLRVAMRKELS